MFTLQTKNVATFAFLLSLSVLTTQATAAHIHNLQDLISMMGDFEVGGKRFFNFEYAATGDMPPADMVNVIEIFDDEGNPGFRLQGGFVDDSASPGASDAFLTYMVESVNPGMLITAAHLRGNPLLIGDSGGINVNETFVESPERAHIFAEENGDTQMVDWATFNGGFSKLSVEKDILALAGPNGDASISFIDQTFSMIPEPTSALLMLMAVMTLGMVRHNTKR